MASEEGQLVNCFEVGDRVEALPGGQVGTVEGVEPRNETTGQVFVHVEMAECPWHLVQPEMSLRPAQTEETS